MEGKTNRQASSTPQSDKGKKALRLSEPQPLRATLVKRVRHATPKATPSRSSESRQPAFRQRSLGYPFIPYPLELVEMERSGRLSKTQVRVLGLRRFADPITGRWFTTTREVAELAGVDRSTACKALCALVRAQFLHIQQLRGRRTSLGISFGGFSHPAHLQEQKTPLRWDRKSGPGGTPTAHPMSQSPDDTHSFSQQKGTFLKPRSGQPSPARGTLPIDTKNEKSVRNYELNDRRDDNSRRINGHLMPIATYRPMSHDESVVHDLARKLGEPYVNSFLALRRRYGLERLQRACGLAQDKRDSTHYPLRSTPGAYVRWLLQNGKC